MISNINKGYRFFWRGTISALKLLKRAHYRLTGQIDLHPDAVIEPMAHLRVDYSSPREHVISVGAYSVVKDYAQLFPRTGFIVIGTHCSINPFCVLQGYGGITIGDHVRIAAHTSLVAFNHNFEDTEQTIREQGSQAKGIVIEDDVWIGSGVRVLDGVRIGKGSVIGAGAVVTADIPPYSVAVGVPARVMRKREAA